MTRNMKTRMMIIGASSNCCARRTCDRWLRWIIVVLWCVTVTCSSRSKYNKHKPQSLKGLINMTQSSHVNQCNLDPKCDWFWNETNGFKKHEAQPSDINDPTMRYPTTDASNSSHGHFLWFDSGPGHVLIWSKFLTRPNCEIEFWSYQLQMKGGHINLILESNSTTLNAVTLLGNDKAKWEKYYFKLRETDTAYKLVLEIFVPSNSSGIGIDNIQLKNCIKDLTSVNVTCTKNMFYCKNGTCLNNTRICDFTKDCMDGEDEEEADCDKIPTNARCNFENGWCGWANVPGRPLNWTLNSGPTPSEKTGPSYDHTYRNKTGTYVYVNMATKINGKPSEYGSRGTIQSTLYNPTPPYSSDRKSPYYHSCQIRFFYHKYAPTSASLGLFLVQVKPHENITEKLWWSYGYDMRDAWASAVVSLPEIKYRYYLQFEAAKSFSGKSEVAIDDISLSRECFAIGVPKEIVKDFDYYNPNIEHEKVLPQYPDFSNKTVIRVTTCGATGRFGPTAEQCAGKYSNKSNVEFVAPTSMFDQKDAPVFNLSGIQRWTAPRGDYYTLIAIGARGGRGSSGKGISLAALARGVIELQKGDELYFMVGQQGTDACHKNLGLRIRSCTRPNNTSEMHRDASSTVRQVQRLEFKNGGGGGGGATAIFMIKANGELEPILIASGGGGLGPGPSTDNGLQHGYGGYGGGWNTTWVNNSYSNVEGMPLIHGGLGGIGCEVSDSPVDVYNYGNGGFGGGGGGCHASGGGGGGYYGGLTTDIGNGGGGYSYANQRLLHVTFKTRIHSGSGEVTVIPAISGCGCNYRCIALDRFLYATECLCPQGWFLSNDSRSCVMIDVTNIEQQTYMILLILAVTSLFAITIIGLIIYYRRYRNNQPFMFRGQATSSNGTELTALRTVSETILTEFNPNYEFAGNLYSFKDLQQIPRECIVLVKPLGQGAFGEVYQGICTYPSDDEGQPVAVKTLPSLSTSLAEADFMMEALIMSKFNHPNIVHFIGVSFEKHPRYIILELLAGGDLKNFLREERPRSDRPTTLTMVDLIMCGYDVANGCKYLEEARFIHRDIAARNCLLTTKGPGRTVKIADFGMARDIYRSDYYKKGGKAMLPVKWMPPESFLDGIFTTKTDVWAFGVLLWEIMSFGYMPYTGCANREVMSMVASGGRLEKPPGCPDPIYGIMTRCWHPRPEDRPKFSTIAERLGYCLQDPDVVNHPTPNFDTLPICDRDITTIMRPDPEAECINVQTNHDRCGNTQPVVMDPLSIGLYVDQIVNTTYNMENRESNKNNDKLCGGTTAEIKKKKYQQETFSYNSFDHFCNNHDNHETETTDTCEEDGQEIDRSDQQDTKTIHSSTIEDCDNMDNSNDCSEEKRHLISTNHDMIIDHKIDNDSTTTSDTNSDSLIVQSSDTPPDVTTNSSPNTGNCSPSRIASLNANVNNDDDEDYSSSNDQQEQPQR
ncbi:ALK tyrosine kinase receptor isoform X2 [Pseudomyrmex gracilis]|uniref:ALK tyrosine kinase receptor isoform X2 n=1 Tax=Pseudomyrmex gracilis TaxID=219809 RepID=UPI00099543E8|nr:ALK tyrosine kinase receptor isoform X2 [Pseudomyrmex gracilis]